MKYVLLCDANSSNVTSLAYAELYLTTAAIFRNFDMALVESSVEDVIAARSFLLGFTKNNTFGINFKVTKVHEV
jgi:hypothetical protein